MRYILGIESSCDDTAAAVFSPQHGVISNELFSQITLHKLFGGVMPEVASRAHIEKIHHIVQSALNSANVSLNEIDLIAVTNGPGLPGSLLVGLCFAKSLAFSKKIPLVGVNHLQAHAISPCIEQAITFPYLCLTASGGHTSLSIIKSYTEQNVIASTRDDAAGEAFDKVAKLLNLGYPGGPIIEQLATQNHYQDVFKYPRLKSNDLFFSFSGLKTAVLYHAIERGWYNPETKVTTITPIEQQAISSSVLCAITDIFISRITIALKQHPEITALAFAGGVACNAYIKQALKGLATQHSLPFYAPSPKYCTDNAAMVAFLGYHQANVGIFSDLALDLQRW